MSNIEFQEYDLTKGQYLYLVRICENPGIIQEKLSEMMKVDRARAVRAIHTLFPTEKGKKVYPFIKRETREIVDYIKERHI